MSVFPRGSVLNPLLLLQFCFSVFRIYEFKWSSHEVCADAIILNCTDICVFLVISLFYMHSNVAAPKTLYFFLVRFASRERYFICECFGNLVCDLHDIIEIVPLK